MKKDIYKKIFEDNYPNVKIEEFNYIKEGNDYFTFDINNSIIIKFPVSKEIEKRIPFEVDLLKKLENKLEILIPALNYNSKDQNQLPFIGYNKIQGIPFDINGSKESIEYNLRILNNLIRNLSFVENSEIDTQIIIDNWKNYYSHLLNGIRVKAYKYIDHSHRLEVENIINQNHNDFVKYNFIPKLIHSDLKSIHLLCKPNDNFIVGLIDWGDAKYGDISFEFARVLNEFGFDFFVRLLNEKEIFLSKDDINRIAFYSILIPFNSILNGVNYSSEDSLWQGIKKLSINLDNYEKVKKQH